MKTPYLHIGWGEPERVRFVDFENKTRVRRVHWLNGQYEDCGGSRCIMCLGANPVHQHYETPVEHDGKRKLVRLPFRHYESVYRIFLINRTNFDRCTIELIKEGPIELASLGRPRNHRATLIARPA